MMKTITEKLIFYNKSDKIIEGDGDGNLNAIIDNMKITKKVYTHVKKKGHQKTFHITGRKKYIYCFFNQINANSIYQYASPFCKDLFS